MAGNGNSGGRNAKSAGTHVLQGTFQRVRHAGHETPEPPPGVPVPPKKLTAEEQGEWDRMITRLQQSKTLSIVDDAALYQYVALFAEVEECKADAERIRKLSKDLMKEVRKLEGSDLLAAVQEIVKLQFLLSKHQTQLRQGHMAIRMYLVEFGQTPSARTRVKLPVEKPAKDDKKTRFFGAARA
jgi:P27 family predicted phage terminase small subunit